MPTTTKRVTWRELPIGARYTLQGSGDTFPRRYIKLSWWAACECVGISTQTIEAPRTRLEELDAIAGNTYKKPPIISAGDPLTLDAFTANADSMVTEGWDN